MIRRLRCDVQTMISALGTSTTKVQVTSLWSYYYVVSLLTSHPEHLHSEKLRKKSWMEI